jgi:hypothetical protein
VEVAESPRNVLRQEWVATHGLVPTWTGYTQILDELWKRVDRPKEPHAADVAWTECNDRIRLTDGVVNGKVGSSPHHGIMAPPPLASVEECSSVRRPVTEPTTRYIRPVFLLPSWFVEMHTSVRLRWGALNP